MKCSTNRSSQLANKRHVFLGTAAAIALAAVMATSLAACGQAGQSSEAGDGTASASASSAASVTTAIPEGAIEWSEASSHVGETVSVYGPVKGASYLSESEGQHTYIDLGVAYPDEHRVSMDIQGKNRDKFPGDPEKIYLDKTVCVTGEIYEHDGVSYIRVASPDQVKVLD